MPVLTFVDQIGHFLFYDLHSSWSFGRRCIQTVLSPRFHTPAMAKEDSDAAKRLTGLAAVTSPAVRRSHAPSPSASAISGSTNISAPSSQPLAPAQTSTTKVVENGLSSNAASIGRSESLVKPSTKERLRKIAIARAASKDLASKSSVAAPAVSENHHAKVIPTATPSLPKVSPSSSLSPYPLRQTESWDLPR